MAYTEFYTQSTGSNLNAGSTNGAATFSFSSGNWVQATGVFTATGANLSGLSVGMFASVYADGASAPTGFVGRITAFDDTADTITVSTTVASGSAPTDGTGNRTIVVGGAWLGPTGASGFPFAFITNALVNASSDRPRVNMKNDATYSITSGITHANAGITFQGYTSSVGDGGKAIIDAGTNAVVVINYTGTEGVLIDLRTQNNGSTGNNAGFLINGRGVLLVRCAAESMRGDGFRIASNGNTLVECEAWHCNTSNTANLGAFTGDGGTPHVYIRCLSHNNTSGSNGHGFATSSSATRQEIYHHCISHSNSGNGFLFQGGTFLQAKNCDAYNNTGDGFRITGNTTPSNIYFENNNFVKNGGYGINRTDSLVHAIFLMNNAFGAGTQANTSGDTNRLGLAQIAGTVNYASNVTPWSDPANANFQVTLAAAINAGRGNFTQVDGIYSGTTTGYPDIGAADHQESAASGGSSWYSGE